jgi:transcriptional regulator with XRE-family HTH domain
MDESYPLPRFLSRANLPVSGANLTPKFAGATIPVTMDTFSTWLLAQLKAREWTQADLCRASKLAPAVVSNIIRRKRNVGPDSAKSIAAALGIPLDVVYVAAGLLPDSKKDNARVRTIDFLASQLPTDEQEGLIEFIRMRQRASEGKHGAGDNKGKGTKSK